MRRFSFASLGLLVVAISLSGVKVASGSHSCCCCPKDFLPMSGFCYKLINELKTRNDAEVFCRKFKPGCHLASIHSLAESVDLAEYVSDYITTSGNVWIGLNDPQQNRVWVWSDRSCTNYLAWAPGEPNNQQKNEYCVELLASTGYKSWNDISCDTAHPFICQCKF